MTTKAGKKTELTPMQRIFISEYLATWNATKAATKAGYSEKTAYSQGARLLKNVEVAAAIDAELGKRALTANEVLARLADHARGTADDFLVVVGDDDASIAMPNFARAKAANKLHLVKQFKIDKEGAISFQLYDAQKALVTLARIHRLLQSNKDAEDDTDDISDEDIAEELGSL